MHFTRSASFLLHLLEKRERSQSAPLTLPASYSFSPEDREKKIAECTSYTPCVLLFFSGGSGAWTGQSSGGSGTARAQQLPHLLPLQLLRASRSPTLRPSAAAATHLGANLARATSTPFHRASPCSTAQSICIRRLLLLCRFLAQHPKNLPETIAPTTRDQLASCFIVPPSAPHQKAHEWPHWINRTTSEGIVHSTRFATFLWHLLFWTFPRKTRCELERFR